MKEEVKWCLVSMQETGARMWPLPTRMPRSLGITGQEAVATPRGLSWNLSSAPQATELKVPFTVPWSE